MTRRYAIVGLGARAGMYVDALLGDWSDAGRITALCDTNGTRMAFYNEKIAAAGDAVAAGEHGEVEDRVHGRVAAAHHQRGGARVVFPLGAEHVGDAVGDALAVGAHEQRSRRRSTPSPRTDSGRTVRPARRRRGWPN